LRIAVTNAWVPGSDGDTVIYDSEGGIIAVTSSYESYTPAVVIDADGRLVTPGLSDTHMHLLATAIEETRLDLRVASSIKDILSLVSREADRLGPGKWIIGRGWDQEKLAERRPPSREELDEAAPSNPVLLVRICGHAAVLNTEGLKASGLMEPPPGLADMVEFEDGRPTGLVYEDAVYAAWKAVPKPSLEEAALAIRRLTEEYLSFGVVLLYSMDASLLEMDAYSASGARIGYKAYVQPRSLEEAVALYPGYVAGIKLYADGSFGARTAALREPYSDSPSTRGKLLLRREEILRYAEEVVPQGLGVAVHAIGDMALEEVLAAAEKVGPHLRIEHASLVPPDLMEKVEMLRPWITVQPHFILSDTWIVDRLGERARWVYPLRSLLASGALVTASSDSPVEPYNPWLGVYAAVDRGREEGLPIWKASGDERLEFGEAVKLYTAPLPPKPPSLVIFNAREAPRTGGEYASIRADTVIIGGEVLTPRREARRDEE